MLFELNQCFRNETSLNKNGSVNPNLNHFFYPKMKLHAVCRHPLPTLQPPRKINLLFVAINLPFLDFSFNEILQYVIFCVWLLPLNIMVLEVIYAAVCITTPFFFIVQEYSVVWIHQFLFICSPVDGHLDCFLLGSGVNGAANEHLPTSLCVDIWFHFS